MNHSYFFKPVLVRASLFSRRILLYVTFVATLLLLSSFQHAYTQSSVPEETRPYLELPFPGETKYEVTCGYGCYQHQGSMSYAVDFAVPEGDPILAAAAGTVKDVTWERGLPTHLDLGDALILYLDHGNGWFTRYVHLDGITVEVGDLVEMGDIIGYGGKTGASGAHLHFELKYGISLHSASVPINELFDGNEPEAGKRYVSNNWTLANKALATQRLAEVQEIEQAKRNADLKSVAEATDTLPAEEERAAEEMEAVPIVEGEEEEEAAEEVAFEPIVDEEREEQAAQEVAQSPIVNEEREEQAAQEVALEPIINEEREEEAAQEVALEPIINEEREEEAAEEVALERIVDEEREEEAAEEVALKPIVDEEREEEEEAAEEVALESNQDREEEEETLPLAALDSPPAPIAEEEPQVPYIETELTLSAPSVRVLKPITATFTLRNGSSERLHLDTLGVVARRKGETTPLNRSLFFDRSIVLNPGRSYHFEQQHTLKQTGDFELFIFAFDAKNNLITLQGAEQLAPLHVEGLPNTIYLPLVKAAVRSEE